MLLMCLSAYAQVGGSRSFEFLNLPVSAKAAALGGVIVSEGGSDVNAFGWNPSLLDTADHNKASWSYLGYYADVRYNSFSYARNISNAGMFGLALHRLGYGEFTGYDEVGDQITNFNAGESALVLSKSHQLGQFRMGANVKFIDSNIDRYRAQAVAVDIGGSFFHPDRELIVSLLFKNFGHVIADYRSVTESTLPSDVQIGITFKPEHMPFRFTFTGYDLMYLGSTYYDEGLDGAEEPGVVGQIARHLSVGLEMVLSQNFNIRAGYNNQTRQELGISSGAGMTGFSLGFMAKIKIFEFSYAFTTQHVAGGRSFFTVTTDLNSIFNKKSIL